MGAHRLVAGAFGTASNVSEEASGSCVSSPVVARPFTRTDTSSIFEEARRRLDVLADGAVADQAEFTYESCSTQRAQVISWSSFRAGRRAAPTRAGRTVRC